ncbi:hypothetical protein IMSHALPRED_006214 [Imshaugia aleurites]|uniref:tRNA N(3)-methylcytidine methyltransferase n=1 Tax=Imshaugia aleurites TaxID=172621 RepID=A0A8H3FH29_9LECA|nr:hypothetical protein IMSHALPRED_006214 [Imshaugia aleurites]
MAASNRDPSPDISSLALSSPTESSNQSIPTTSLTELPPHRSHNPSDNLKRSDPFKFGSRYLEPTDDVFEFNAWDHVVPDSAYHTYCEAQYTSQRASPVSDFDKARFNNNPEKWWNRFYSNNTSNFFKDRKWLHQEFPVLSKLTAKDAGPSIILEVGAGAGNTAFPILKANENEELVIHACDFSKTAVELIRANAAYDDEHMQASVWDISGEDMPPGVQEGSVDLVLLVFIFSALNPRQWDAAVRNVWRVLKPGGEVCFRDYGKGDLTQVRFKKGRLLEDNFYIRGDGTRVYFFEEDELKRIWGGTGTANREVGANCEGGGSRSGTARDERPKDTDEVCTRGEAVPHRDLGVLETESAPSPLSENAFEIVSLGVDRRMLVNRQKQLKMYRCWMQGQFKKPHGTTLIRG